MTKDEFLRELEKTLNQDQGSLTTATPLDQIGWDSFGEMAFLSLVDKQLGIQVPADAVSECRTVAQLLDLVAGPVSA
jgi:acyl carrier protein